MRPSQNFYANRTRSSEDESLDLNFYGHRVVNVAEVSHKLLDQKDTRTPYAIEMMEHINHIAKTFEEVANRHM